MKSAKSISNRVVAASFFAVFCLFGFRSTFSVLQGPMGDTLGWSGAQLSAGYSIMMMIYAITAFFSGRIVDKRGSRPVFLIGAVFCCLGMVATSFVTDFFVYCACYGIFAGIGTGMLWVSSTASVRKWFIGDKYSTMWGIAFAGAPVSQVILSLSISPMLASNPANWRTSMMIMGFVFLALLFVAAWLAQRNPADYGYEAFGELPQKKDAEEVRDFTVKEAFRTYPIWAAVLAFLGSMLGEFLIWSQIVKYWTTNLGMDLTAATNLYVVIGIAGIFTMPILGKIGDIIVKKIGNEAKGRKILLIVAPAVGAISCALLLVMKADNIALGIALCIAFAVYWAIEPGGVAGYAGSLYGSRNFGKIWGLATLIVMFVGPATGSFMGGFLADMTGNYSASVVFAMGGYLFSFVFALTMPVALKAARKARNVEAAPVSAVSVTAAASATPVTAAVSAAPASAAPASAAPVTAASASAAPVTAAPVTAAPADVQQIAAEEELVASK